MARRLQAPVRRRQALPLTEQDIADLARLRSSAVLRQALQDASPDAIDAEHATESSIVHAVFAAGLAAIAEAAEELGYERLAQDYDTAARKGSARRRAPSWAADA